MALVIENVQNGLPGKSIFVRMWTFEENRLIGKARTNILSGMKHKRKKKVDNIFYDRSLLPLRILDTRDRKSLI